MKKTFCLILVLLMLLSICGCGRVYEGGVTPEVNVSQPAERSIPFSEADWSWTAEDMKAAEGEPEETYASIYGGDCCTYTRDYLGRTGTLKYMFAEDGRLASVAWAYADDDDDAVNSLYSEIIAAETAVSGPCTIESEEAAVNSGVWYLDDCDILVYTIFSNGSGALQYSYVNRDYSKRDIKGNSD